MWVTTGQRKVKPPGHPQLHSLCRVGSWMGVRRDFSLVGFSAHQLVWEPDSQEPSAEPQTQNRPPWVPT